MQQVADWLQKLGLGQYAQRFAENDIILSILPDLTDQDLKELGVASLGHRRQLLRAIVELKGNEIIAHKAVNENIIPVAPRETAERRQVTVMFSDLVGSTALSTRMDPEDLREVISAYQKCVADTVQRFGGFVAKYMGDGVLVYFGYPQAHEDDAERAVRSGLELMEALAALKSQTTLQTRVGIATGLVVVGDLIGSGASQEQAIVGETPNLAARLQGVAEPNAVVIAESTRKLLGNLFQLEDLGAQDLKGISGPVRAWTALRPATVESRFEAMHATGLTELVGREEEFELLLRRWTKARSGEGQVVLISGEPGIGKSRLTAALLKRLATEPHSRLRYFCSPQHTDSALYPIISQMERASGFAHTDTVQAKLDKLDAVLAQTVTPKQDAALFAEMLSLPDDGRYPKLDLTPQQRRQKTLEALNAQVDGLSRANPVLMIFEDAHWTDPTSLEALGRAVDRIRTLAVLLIVTYRPEFTPPWVGQPHVTPITVNRLGQREIAEMIDRVTGNKPLPASVLEDILERADGIPLFVEEITKAVLEAGDQTAEQVISTIPSPSIPVPATLHASLMARLDRLGSAKSIAQIGAVAGREFSHALLAAVAHTPEAELQSALERLTEAGLLFRQGIPPDATYLFKHALIQDAAYGTLLREAKRALHARIAETLETQFAEIAESQPGLLAKHFTEAGLTNKAVNYWSKAGQRSLARSALSEAVEQLKRAIELIAALPGTTELRREQIKLQVALANALMHTKGFATPETKAALAQARLLIERAEALGEPPEDPLLLFSILYGFWATNYVGHNGDALRELASQFLTLAQKQTATGPLVVAHRLMGSSFSTTGDVFQGRKHLDKAIALYDRAEHSPLATRFGQDVGVVILSFRSWTVWALGYPDAAKADIECALKNAREIGHAPTLMYSLYFAPWTAILRGDYVEANARAEELIALGDQKRATFWKEGGIIIRGCILTLTGQAEAAIQTINRAMTFWRSAGSTVNFPLFLAHLATAYAQVGQFDESSRCAREALSTTEATNERVWEAELHRMSGEIARITPVPGGSSAEAYFERALAISRQQQAKSLELRAAMSLGRLWRDRGKRQEAHELLAPVYGWFTEGFDTRDLKEAKALLEELST
jgi:class 3 adenylate cyclase/predicted ATPase